jgi:hypothetical protein
MGIFGIRNHTLQGFKWNRVKLRAMEESAAADLIIIDLTAEEIKQV